MNYQYNQQPNQPPFQPPPPIPQMSPPPSGNYFEALLAKEKKKADFEKFSGKVEEFCKGNSFLATLFGFSDILSYIVTGICVIGSIIMMFLGSIYSVLCISAILVGAFAVSKKTVLPLALAFSGVALVKLINFVFTAVYLDAVGNLAMFSTEAAALSTAYVLQIIYILLELAVLVFPTVMAWSYFAATLPPRVYQPVPLYGQAPPQDYGQIPPQPYGQVSPQQPVPQVYQQPSVQQAAPPVQPEAESVQAEPPSQPQPENKYCSACGTKNRLEAIFCSGCGQKLDS